MSDALNPDADLTSELHRHRATMVRLVAFAAMLERNGYTAYAEMLKRSVFATDVQPLTGSDLTENDVSQLRHHIRDHRATCASSCALIERLLDGARAPIDKERVRQVVRATAMTGVCEAIGLMMGPTYWHDNPSAHGMFAKVADDIASRVADELCKEIK